MHSEIWKPVLTSARETSSLKWNEIEIRERYFHALPSYSFYALIPFLPKKDVSYLQLNLFQITWNTTEKQNFSTQNSTQFKYLNYLADTYLLKPTWTSLLNSRVQRNALKS